MILALAGSLVGLWVLSQGSEQPHGPSEGLEWPQGRSQGLGQLQGPFTGIGAMTGPISGAGAATGSVAGVRTSAKSVARIRSTTVGSGSRSGERSCSPAFAFMAWNTNLYVTMWIFLPEKNIIKAFSSEYYLGGICFPGSRWMTLYSCSFDFYLLSYSETLQACFPIIYSWNY